MTTRSTRARPALAVAAAILLAPAAAPALAHDFIVKPGASAAAAGAAVPVSLLMTERYIRPGRMPPAAAVRLEAVSAAGRTAVPVTGGAAGTSLDGTATAPAEGTLVLLGTMSLDRSKTAEGVRPLPKGAPGTTGTTRTENFSKALVNAASADPLPLQPVGTRLEIVPLDHPAGLAAGGTLRVRVLFDGRPVAARLQATYDGLSDKEHAFTSRTESGADGVASVPLTAPGLWMVRTRHAVDEVTPAYDHYGAAANLVFTVK